MYSKNNNVLAQHGSSLLETMVSLFVLAIGLLGTLAMQTKSIQHNQNSYSYSQAIVLATDLNERLSVSTDTDADLKKWQDEVKNKLPAGKGSIDNQKKVTGGITRKITIEFNESAAGELSNKTRQIEFKTWF